MATYEERLEQLRKQIQDFREQIAKRGFATLLRQMQARLQQYDGSVQTVSEDLWEDLVGKDYLTPEQHEDYRLLYGYCVAVEERRVLQEQFHRHFNTIAQQRGCKAAVAWKRVTPYLRPVLETASFIAATISILDKLMGSSGPHTAPVSSAPTDAQSDVDHADGGGRLA